MKYRLRHALMSVAEFLFVGGVVRFCPIKQIENKVSNIGLYGQKYCIGFA